MGKITIPKVAKTKIGVPNPPNITARLAQRDEKTALIKPPKNLMLYQKDK